MAGQRGNILMMGGEELEGIITRLILIYIYGLKYQWKKGLPKDGLPSCLADRMHQL
jgi:hypothetical protein